MKYTMKQAAVKFVKAENTAIEFIEYMNAIASEITYDEESLGAAGKEFFASLPKGYEPDAPTLAVYLARAGFTSEATRWFMQGASYRSDAAIGFALDKAYGVDRPKRGGGGPKPKSKVDKAAAFVTKLGMSTKEIDKLVELLKAMK